jgi:hypothetical protein
MAEDYLLRLGMTADEALSFAIQKVNAAETWELLAKDWKRIKDIVAEVTRLVRLRNKTRRKLSTGNIERIKTLSHLWMRVLCLLCDFLVRRKDDPTAARRLNRIAAELEEFSGIKADRFTAGWEAFSEILKSADRFTPNWEAIDWEAIEDILKIDTQ